MSDIQADPNATISHRAAKMAVIVLSALIILALIGLVAGVAWKLTRGSAASSSAPGSGAAFVLPAGASILSSDVQQGRIVLRVHSGEGDEVDIFSADDGHLIARIKAAPPPVPTH